MTNYNNDYEYFTGDYVLAHITDWGDIIKTYILLHYGVGGRNYWVTGKVLNLKTGTVRYSTGNIYKSDIVRKLTNVEVAVAKLRGLV